MFYGVDNSITWKINTSILLGPDEYGLHGCPPHCGCPENPSDCPRWYSLDSVKESAVASDLYVLDNQRKKLEHARRRAKTLCEVNEGVVGLTGGWCLKPQNNGKSIEFPNGVAYELAQFHTKPSTRIVKELVNLFLAENVTTVNDFGAGIAQYKAAITRALPLIHYDAYDGAGNGEEYTKGMMSFVDLTLALDLPVAEWMISLEVGEHIPSKYEGMFIRNLHRHNKKGVVLSWAVLGQGGHSHVNNHSNEYVIQLFEGLGYTYDDGLTKKLRLPTQNRQWFTNSVFVFRRTGFEM
ncbi:unnamed protein product [Cylindrotheca closterium]|uniref:Methyltransferase n=1 Tax=Cylindrotheca closterium TaxID=2856 RepID=A0AAD2CGB5_9STRA|nr:unnamed protein product [Cylindrotheca closterium]